MTVADIAGKLNTTSMTIYRRLKKAGIDIQDLRDENGITQDGASQIAALFPDKATTQAAQVDTDSNITNTVDVSAAVLQARLDGAMELIAHLRNERDELRRQLDAVTMALQAEQADRTRERQLLTAGVEDATNTRRRGLFWWLRR